MNGAPVRQGRMLGIMRDHALLETRYAGIVHEHVDHRNDLRQALPIRFFADVELFEPAAYRRRSLGTGGFVDVGEDDDGAFVWKRSAIARPMPRAAPVMTQIFMFSLGIWASKYESGGGLFRWLGPR